MMYWYDHGMGGWGPALMTFWTLAFIGLLVGAAVLFARYLGRDGRAAAAGGVARTSERILAERFASGEIDDDEYRRRLNLLRAST